MVQLAGLDIAFTIDDIRIIDNEPARSFYFILHYRIDCLRKLCNFISFNVGNFKVVKTKINMPFFRVAIIMTYLINDYNLAALNHIM